MTEQQAVDVTGADVTDLTPACSAAHSPNAPKAVVLRDDPRCGARPSPRTWPRAPWRSAACHGRVVVPR